MAVSLRIGDKVKTNFYPAEKERFRTITKMQQWPSPSGFLVETDNELELDSAWFNKVA